MFLRDYSAKRKKLSLTMELDSLGWMAMVSNMKSSFARLFVIIKYLNDTRFVFIWSAITGQLYGEEDGK